MIKVMTIPEATERHDKITKNLKELGLEGEFVYGFKGDLLPDCAITYPIPHLNEPWRTIDIRKRGYSANLTSLRCVELAQKESLEYFMLLEDDCFLKDNPLKYLDRVPSDWDIIIVDGHNETKNNGTIKKNIYLHCQIIHSRAYQRYLDLVGLYTDAHDEAMNYSGFFSKVKSYALNGLAGQRNIDSLILGKNRIYQWQATK